MDISRYISRDQIGICIVPVLISCAIYVLPVLMPLHIGTGYIGLHVLMALYGLYIWRSGKLEPHHCLFLGIFVLLILLPLSPITSNDAERYLWDGAVMLDGHDPYVTAPNDMAVSALRDMWITPEEHAQYPTLYPPGALGLFSLSALAGPEWALWLWKGLATLAGILTLVLAHDLLKRCDGLKHFPLIALSPLLLFETGVGAHVDIFSVLGVTFALWCLQRDKILFTGIVIGVAATIKFLPAVMAGPLLFYLKPRSALKLFLSASLTWAFVYLGFLGLGYKPLGLLPTFFEKWRGGAPLYPILETLGGKLRLSNTAFLVLLGVLAIVGFSASAVLARQRHILTAIMVALATPLLLSPVLFPWYVMAFIPFLALRPNATLFMTVTLSPLSYIVLDKWLSQGVWRLPAWPSLILIIGLLIGLVIDLYFIKLRNPTFPCVPNGYPDTR